MGEWQRCDNNAVWKDSGVRVKLQGEGVRVTDECLKRVCQECGVDIAEVIVEEGTLDSSRARSQNHSVRRTKSQRKA
jgi:hypothetical protein